MRNIKKMANHGTTMIDIYEAAGGEVSEDRSQVTIHPENQKPFKIELLVLPVSIETSYDAPDEVTFGVILNDEVMFEEEAFGHKILTHEFDATVKLPVSQVKIIKEK